MDGETLLRNVSCTAYYLVVFISIQCSWLTLSYPSNSTLLMRPNCLFFLFLQHKCTKGKYSNLAPIRNVHDISQSQNKKNTNIIINHLLHKCITYYQEVVWDLSLLKLKGISPMLVQISGLFLIFSHFLNSSHILVILILILL